VRGVPRALEVAQSGQVVIADGLPHASVMTARWPSHTDSRFPDAERTRGERVAAERAIEWLRALSATWTEADVPEAGAGVLHAICD
jgi:hypothetical protein